VQITTNDSANVSISYHFSIVNRADAWCFTKTWTEIQGAFQTFNIISPDKIPTSQSDWCPYEQSDVPDPLVMVAMLEFWLRCTLRSPTLELFRKPEVLSFLRPGTPIDSATKERQDVAYKRALTKHFRVGGFSQNIHFLSFIPRGVKYGLYLSIYIASLNNWRPIIFTLSSRMSNTLNMSWALKWDQWGFVCDNGDIKDIIVVVLTDLPDDQHRPPIGVYQEERGLQRLSITCSRTRSSNQEQIFDLVFCSLEDSELCFENSSSSPPDPAAGTEINALLGRKHTPGDSRRYD
jgi:hypothetical protein